MVTCPRPVPGMRQARGAQSHGPPLTESRSICTQSVHEPALVPRSVKSKTRRGVSFAKGCGSDSSHFALLSAVFAKHSRTHTQARDPCHPDISFAAHRMRTHDDQHELRSGSCQSARPMLKESRVPHHHPLNFRSCPDFRIITNCPHQLDKTSTCHSRHT
jgi:hypothetical protein